MEIAVSLRCLPNRFAIAVSRKPGPSREASLAIAVSPMVGNLLSKVGNEGAPLVMNCFVMFFLLHVLLGGCNMYSDGNCN